MPMLPVEGHPAAADQSFPCAHRLLKRRMFLHTYEQGRRVPGRLAVIFCIRRDDDGPWRIGLTVTKKTANSVLRNRLRRRVREFFRRHGTLLPPGWDFVINLKSTARTANSAELDADLAKILGRLGFDLSVAPSDSPEALA